MDDFWTGYRKKVNPMRQNILADIKRNLESSVGQKVMLKANRGRRKTVIKEGILERTYPSIFIVRLGEEDDSFRRLSFSYTDVLTDTVEVTVYAEGGMRRIQDAS